MGIEFVVEGQGKEVLQLRVEEREDGDINNNKGYFLGFHRSGIRADIDDFNYEIEINKLLSFIKHYAIGGIGSRK